MDLSTIVTIGIVLATIFAFILVIKEQQKR